jgi:hypothetical protein
MEKEFGRIKKNSTTEIVIRVSEYKGSVGLDIREYVKSDRYTGWSKSGVRIPEDHICELGKIIAEACKEIRKE